VKVSSRSRTRPIINDCSDDSGGDGTAICVTAVDADDDLW
jgi:hypothetical protein